MENLTHLIKYNELLENLNIANQENHLFLANGFNISLGVQTDYKSIFEKMQEKYKGYADLNLNENYDLEHIIGELKNQIINDSPRKIFLDTFINNKVKADFMKAASEIAKAGLKNIYQEKNQGIGLLFKNFNNYFTLNYDPFLYLLLMKYKKKNTNNVLGIQNTFNYIANDLDIRNSNAYKEIKEIYFTYSKELTNQEGQKVIDTPLSLLPKTDFETQLREILKSRGRRFNKECVQALYDELNGTGISLDINDGFVNSLFKADPVIDPFVQNVYFLHGTFHIYQDKQSIYKITKDKDKALYDKLDEIINEEDKEIITVFTNDDKVSEIKNNAYLTKGYNKLKELTGNLVIIGSSLDMNDNHIFNALNESALNKIYFASSEGNKGKHKIRLMELFPKKEVILVDRDSITYS